MVTDTANSTIFAEMLNSVVYSKALPFTTVLMDNCAHSKLMTQVEQRSSITRKGVQWLTVVEFSPPARGWSGQLLNLHG